MMHTGYRGQKSEVGCLFLYSARPGSRRTASSSCLPSAVVQEGELSLLMATASEPESEATAEARAPKPSSTRELP
jgi:hypothetical protein